MAFEGTLVFDNLDLDLVMKVLSNTLFSPFFIFFVPVIYKSQGQDWDAPVIRNSIIYWCFLSVFWAIRFSSKLWRNKSSWVLSGPRINWEDQVVIITGGASGIGRLLAETLAVRNVCVAVLDTQPLNADNENINYYKCDVSKWEEVEKVAKEIAEELGDPTIVVNNAAVVQGKKIVDLSPEDIKQTLDTNLLSHFWTLKAFLPQMVEQQTGHIVTISSVMGMVGAAQMSDYCATKAALINLHESLRYELDKCYKTPYIRTTLVTPGHVITPLFSRANLQTSSWFKFAAPQLAPHFVVKAIIAALDEQESREISMPFYTNFVPLIRLLPSWSRDFFQWLSGADSAMNGFTKITGRRPEEGTAPPLEANGKSRHD
jgi:NAD(P)-dependent dehydrogenase (short-subunit alcohol dehydrogenase family)